MPNTSDFAIPEVKLIQSIGGDEAKAYGAQPGMFYISLTQEILPAEGFDIVVVQPPSKNRTYWGREVIEDEPPVCASLDGTTSINGDVCEKACPYKAFTDAPYLLNATERRLKCTANYNVLGLKTNDMMPVIIRCSGISAQAAKELNTLLGFHKVLRGGQQFKATIHVSSVKKKTDYGESFAIKFGNPVLIQDPKLLTEVKEQFLALAGTSTTQINQITLGQETEDPSPAAAVAGDQIQQEAKAPSTTPPAAPPRPKAVIATEQEVTDLFGPKNAPPVGEKQVPQQQPVKKPTAKMDF